MKNLTQTEMLLEVLKDGRLHRNFDIIREIKARFYNGYADMSLFPVAARIKDLKKKYDIEGGNPEHFNKVRYSRGDWYYRLTEEV